MAAATAKAKEPETAGRAEIPSPEAIYDPVGRVLDVVGDRWSFLLVRHLLLGPKGFQELRKRTGIAPRVLSTRLKELADLGFVESLDEGGYALTELGRTLEPIIGSIARWFTLHGMAALNLEASQFTETTPQSILESLPFLVREERAKGAHVVFEIRLTGPGGGVWTVQLDDGRCTVEEGFAEQADARYTADSKAWCGVALGLTGAREMIDRGLMSKEGKAAMDFYFHQIGRESAGAGKKKASTPRGKRRTKS